MMRASPLRRVERLARVIQNFTIIFGVFAGAIAVLNSRVDKRIEHTMMFRKEFNDGVRKDYLHLVGSWDRYAGEQHFVSAGPEGQKQIVMSFFSRPENVDDLRNISDFAYTLVICLRNRTCDRNTAIDLFSDDITFIYEISGYYIADRREAYREPTVGLGLEEISNMRRESSIRRYL